MAESRKYCPSCSRGGLSWLDTRLQTAYIQIREKNPNSYGIPGKLKMKKIGMVCKTCGYFEFIDQKD